MVKRAAAAAAVIALGLVAVWVLSGTYTPPDPAECAALRTLAATRPDVTYEMDARGCPDPPYEQLNERRAR